MRLRSLESLFERYRRKGDLAALGEVFDRVAPDLLRLACHLVRGHDAAEDVLQATFVVAIERAQRFDPERELRPWLTGILARQAAAHRRREGRSLDEERLLPRTAADPEQAAEAEELSHHLGSALERLGEPYRTSLEPYLRDGLSPAEIARGLGLAPGTVRMRIHRGLDRLRDLLPAGVAAGLAGSVLAPRGLSAVRVSVLAKASTLAPAASAVTAVASSGAGSAAGVLASTTQASVLGSLIMSKATTLAGLGLLAGLAGLWLVRDSGHRPVHTGEPVIENSEGAGVSSSGASVALIGPGTKLSSLPAETASSDSAQQRTAVESETTHRPKIRVQGWIDGVADRHLEQVVVGWSRQSPELTRASLAALSDAGMAAMLQDRYRQLASDSSLVVAEANGEPQVETAVGPEGRFSLEIPVPPDWNSKERESWVVQAEHELYFEGQATLELTGSQRLALNRGEDALVQCRVELRPAAVVRGKVRDAEEGEGGLWSVGTYPPAYTDYKQMVENAAALSAIEADMLVVTQFVAEGELDADGFVSPTPSIRFRLQPAQAVSVALFPTEHGKPEEVPSIQRELGFDGEFELKLERGGPFVLAAVKGDRRPATRSVDLILAEVVELDPIELEAGASLSGFAPALEASGATMCRAVASLPENGDELQVEWAGGLTWFGKAFEWTRREADFEEDSRFEILGLAPTTYSVDWQCEADLDLRSSGGAPPHTPISCSAPAHDLVLGPPVSFLELVFTRDGVPIEELPEEEDSRDFEDGSSAPVSDQGLQLSLTSDEGPNESLLRKLSIHGVQRLTILSEPEREHSLSISDEDGPLLDLSLRSPALGRREEVRVETTRR